MGSRVWIFTREEFVLMAAAAGIRQMYGFEANVRMLGREDAIQVLQGLNVRNCLTSVDGRFELSGDVKVLFDQIKNAATIMDIHKSSGKSCILYIDSGAVRVSPSMRRKDSLEIQEIPLSELWNFLQEEGWIRESQSESRRKWI